MTVGGTATMTAVNAHIRLLVILRNVVKDIYPRARNLGCKGVGTHRVNYSRITKIETKLDEWFQSIATPSHTEDLRSESLRLVSKEREPRVICSKDIVFQDAALASISICSCSNGALSTVHSPYRTSPA
jgi:hypothetical protein